MVCNVFLGIMTRCVAAFVVYALAAIPILLLAPLLRREEKLHCGLRPDSDLANLIDSVSFAAAAFFKLDRKGNIDLSCSI